MKRRQFHPLGLQKRQMLCGLCLCAPTTAGLLVFYLLPLGMALWRSLHEGSGTRFVGLRNYQALFHNAAFRLAAHNTLLFWGIALPLNLLLGLAAALLCEEVSAKKRKFLLFFPALLPASCVVALAQALVPGVGNLDGQSGRLLLLLLYLWKSCGCTVLLLAAALHAIPRELVEEAASCGADGRQLLWYIRLPLLLPAVGVSAVVALLNSLRIFRESLLLWGAHPANALYGLQHFLSNNYADLNYPRLAAASLLLVGVCAGCCAHQKGWFL